MQFLHLLLYKHKKSTNDTKCEIIESFVNFYLRLAQNARK